MDNHPLYKDEWQFNVSTISEIGLLTIFKNSL